MIERRSAVLSATKALKKYVNYVNSFSPLSDIIVGDSEFMARVKS